MRLSHAAGSVTREFRRDDVVFAEGSEGEHMYVIVSGEVAICKATEHGQRQLAALGPGEIFGEMALLDSGVRGATAIASSDEVRLMAIDQGHFVYLVSQQPAFALSVMRVLAQRIAALNAQVGRLQAGHA